MYILCLKLIPKDSNKFEQKFYPLIPVTPINLFLDVCTLHNTISSLEREQQIKYVVGNYKCTNLQENKSLKDVLLDRDLVYYDISFEAYEIGVNMSENNLKYIPILPIDAKDDNIVEEALKRSKKVNIGENTRKLTRIKKN